MEVIILPDADSVAQTAADIVRDMVITRPDAVLGLATGSTPILLYEKLVQRYQAGQLSFRQVTTFNLDEYVGVAADSPLSYRGFMHEHLFSKIDIELSNTHLPECAGGVDPRRVGPGYERGFERVMTVVDFRAVIGTRIDRFISYYISRWQGGEITRTEAMAAVSEAFAFSTSSASRLSLFSPATPEWTRQS